MGYQIVVVFAANGSCGMIALRHFLCCKRVIIVGIVRDEDNDMPYLSIIMHIPTTISGNQEECIRNNKPCCLCCVMNVSVRSSVSMSSLAMGCWLRIQR